MPQAPEPPALPPQTLERLRALAYALPQVLRPADLGLEDGRGTDTALREKGLLLLQKALTGQRPSRWIEPRLVAAALAHVEAMAGQPHPRPLMLERTNILHGMGVSRVLVAGLPRWLRLTRHSLALPEPGWTLPLLFHAPVDEEALWAWFRDGELDALQAALGAPQPYPQAAALLAHVQALVDSSRAAAPQHLASLLPALQAETATPREPEALRAACTRAQERWARRAQELDTLQGLESELGFASYPDSFAAARRLQRKVVIYAGPPNSGKTHAAFERLAQALDGAYLAPLRLLALEGRDRLLAQGVPCSLLTGEENVPAPGARVVSSTIEMLSTTRELDVAVVDEAQMLFDGSRGWAWTQAIVGAPARELIVICSSYAVPAVRNLLGLCGERAELREFIRKQHVDLLPKPLPVASLALGDAVVAFSRREVLQLRDRIAAAGHPTSVIYGALPPEVRKREAERFASGESHILVATDAIGMGLNLPIRRVLFATLLKFDGTADRPLEETEAHQIAGRAGRFGMHDEGFAGVLDEAEPDALQRLRELLARQPQAPSAFKAPVAPGPWHLDTIASRLNLDKLSSVLAVFMEQLKLDDAHFQVAELQQMLDLATQLDACAASLNLRQRFIYAQAPVDVRSEDQVQDFLAWAESHARSGQAGRPAFLDRVDGHSRLDRMEQGLRACTLWLWLGLRFEGVFGHVQDVLDLRESLNEGIERQLAGAKPLARERQRRGGRR